MLQKDTYTPYTMARLPQQTAAQPISLKDPFLLPPFPIIQPIYARLPPTNTHSHTQTTSQFSHNTLTTRLPPHIYRKTYTYWKRGSKKRTIGLNNKIHTHTHRNNKIHTHNHHTVEPVIHTTTSRHAERWADPIHYNTHHTRTYLQQMNDVRITYTHLQRNKQKHIWTSFEHLLTHLSVTAKKTAHNYMNSISDPSSHNVG